MLVTIECILTDLWLWILQAPVQLVSYYATSQITIMEQVWILEVVVCQSPIKNLKYLKIKLSSIADNEVNSGKEMNKENTIKNPKSQRKYSFTMIKQKTLPLSFDNTVRNYFIRRSDIDAYSF